MQAGFKLWRENHIDRPLQLNPAKAFKCFRNYPYGVMCFPARGSAGMACMFGTVIGDFEQFRLEGLL